MGMDSYLELFTTIYGWTLSNSIYSILVDTGIVFLPLIATVIAVWIEAHEGGAETVEWAIRKMEVEIYVALFVISVAFVPAAWTSLDNSFLTYTPDATVANPAPTTVNTASSGSTYNAAFAGSTGASVPVPVWWYTVMGLSSGVNAAVRASVANSHLGLRQAEELARLARIEDPALRGEAQMFRNQCFVPAHAKFHSPDTPRPAILATTVALYGQDDTEWIGSHLYQDDPDYYASLRAWQVVIGFDFDPTADDKDAPPGVTSGSMPNCLRWWADGTNGLRTRLVASGTSAQRAVDAAAGITNALFGSGPGDVEDQILRQMLWRQAPNFVQTDQIIGGRNKSRWELPEFLSGWGIMVKGFEASFSYYPIVQFMALAQPLILMGLYIFLPLIMVFSRFSLQFMVYGALAIFTVKFWAAMWTIARFIDERLVIAMYGSDTNLVREYFTNGLDGGAKRAILNVLTLGLFLALPLMWNGMMMWIGFRVGAALDKAVESAHKGGGAAGAITTKRIGKETERIRDKK
jgi:hypothetical protein